MCLRILVRAHKEHVMRNFLMEGSLDGQNNDSGIVKTMVRPMVLLMLLGLLGMTSCQKRNEDTLREIYKSFKNGEISECKYKGKRVYGVAINAFDAGNAILDKNGNLIGSCIYASGSVDPICSEVKNCEVVYRVEDNIWGRPAVDKYGLGDYEIPIGYTIDQMSRFRLGYLPMFFNK